MRDKKTISERKKIHWMGLIAEEILGGKKVNEY